MYCIIEGMNLTFKRQISVKIVTCVSVLASLDIAQETFDLVRGGFDFLCLSFSPVESISTYL